MSIILNLIIAVVVVAILCCIYHFACRQMEEDIKKTYRCDDADEMEDWLTKGGEFHDDCGDR